MAERARKMLWRLVTIGSLVLAASALWRTERPMISARGKFESMPQTAAMEQGYEPDDVNVRFVRHILMGIAGTVVLTVGIVFLMVWRFDVAQTQPWHNLTGVETARVVPPAPHLQIEPFADLARQRAREGRLLDSYGWTSVDHSSARIPIQRAMTLTVGTSLDAGP
jgi:hypothetical protein